jgi:hypothetical protein
LTVIYGLINFYTLLSEENPLPTNSLHDRQLANGAKSPGLVPCCSFVPDTGKMEGIFGIDRVWCTSMDAADGPTKLGRFSSKVEYSVTDACVRCAINDLSES